MPDHTITSEELESFYPKALGSLLGFGIAVLSFGLWRFRKRHDRSN